MTRTEGFTMIPEDFTMNPLACSICGGGTFREQTVLWPELVAEWQLTNHERDYIDLQQGRSCTNCGANLRIIALGNAIRSTAGILSSLQDAIKTDQLSNWRILDCNGADGISPALSMLPFYQRADYPEYDMRRLPFPDGSFDLVVHSDTLEHIEHPVLALQECRRVLAPDGRLCFTVPTIIGRLTRNRAGLTPSYHGDPTTGSDDLIVHTEFGADTWTFVHQAGFTNVTINQIEFPSGIAIAAWTELPMDWPEVEAAPSANEEVSTQNVAEIADQRIEALEDVAAPHPIYDQDGLRSVHNHEFMQEPEFQSAYARGMKAAGAEYHWHWRVHTGLWAARMAAKLPGDFAEFGVNRGFLSSAIMQMLDWKSVNRRFYLLDTFAGIDHRYINEDDRRIGVVERNARDIASGFYTFDLERVRANFAEWPSAIIIPGAVPDTLDLIDSDCFAFAHIDMNCAPPELAAMEFLWPRLVPGAVVLLDDYAYAGYESQKLAMDAFARDNDVPILALPTGQGLIIKPPS